MKTIGRKELISKIRAGEADNKSLRRPEEEDFDLDEREPIERVADEMETFSKSLLNMSRQQAESMSKMLGMMIQAVNKMAAIKVDIPAMPEQQKQIDSWSIKVVKRSDKGLIEQISLQGGYNG